MIRGSLVRPFVTLGLLLAMFPATAARPEHTTWRELLATPTYSTYRQMGDLPKASCDANRPSDSHLMELLRLLSGGNSAVFQALLDIRRCLDGGALEDFYRASGSYLEAQPHAFVSLVLQNKVSNSELNYMLVMLPLSTVDQPDLRLKVLSDRIDTLTGIKVERLSTKAIECRQILAKETSKHQKALDGGRGRTE